MVFAAPTPRRVARVAPAPHRADRQAVRPARLTACLAPNEHLTGTPDDQAALLERLAALRATAALHTSHPDLTFSLLPWVLDHLGADAWEIFRAGFSLMTARYEELGLHHLLPTDRVWVGVRSSREGAFGGFHYRDQGYRHLQMGAVVTRYGDLSTPANPCLAALDLLRAYAHDCLHYGSYREYRLLDGEVFRAQYGVNRRDASGNSYSAPDPEGAGATRNLGIIQEGATDREASAIARHAAEQVGLAIPAGAHRFAYLDVTGQLNCEALSRLPRHPPEPGTSATADRFLASMGSYARAVNNPYRAFLAEIGGRGADELHTTITKAMISGSVSALATWLETRSPCGFAGLFRSSSYTGPEPA